MLDTEPNIKWTATEPHAQTLRVTHSPGWRVPKAEVMASCSPSSSCHSPPHTPGSSTPASSQKPFTPKLYEPSVIPTVPLNQSSLSERTWPPSILSFPMIRNETATPQKVTLCIINISLCEDSNGVRRPRLSRGLRSAGLRHPGGGTEAAALQGQTLGLHVVVSSLSHHVQIRNVKVGRAVEELGSNHFENNALWWGLRGERTGKCSQWQGSLPPQLCSSSYSHKSPPNQVKLPTLSDQTPDSQVSGSWKEPHKY